MTGGCWFGVSMAPWEGFNVIFPMELLIRALAHFRAARSVLDTSFGTRRFYPTKAVQERIGWSAETRTGRSTSHFIQSVLLQATLRAWLPSCRMKASTSMEILQTLTGCR